MKAAIYTRFSSDKQREASTVDQHRNCERRATAEGWPIAAHFKDEAISGSRSDRPGYQAMLRAALAGEFGVLLLDDLSRLSRDQVEAEQAIRRLEHRGVRVIALSDGYDSQSKSRKIHRGIKGLMNEVYLDDLRDKTHRGLEGQALKGNNTGGRAYGYRHVPIEDPAQRDTYGRPLVIAVRREIDEVQASVVRRIFEWYADGRSPRWIAEELNREGVPSPGSTWHRRQPIRGWAATAIAGPMVGTGILNNELYIGRYVWNRSQWVKNPDTGRRERRDRPEGEWVVNTMHELRIVSDALWQRVKRRQKERADTIGARVRAGLSPPAARRSGPPGKYLFSTLLKCDVCGGSLVVASRTHYACASTVNGRRPFCGNGRRVKRTVLEAALLHDVRTKMLAPDVVRAVCAEFPKMLAALVKKSATSAKRLAELEAENERLAESVGRMGGSPALEARLASNQKEIERLRDEATAPTAKVTRLVPKIAESYRALVADLGNVALRDVGRARADLRRLYGGEIRVRPSVKGDYLEAAVPSSDRLIELAVAGLGFTPSTSGVAGARNLTQKQVRIR